MEIIISLKYFIFSPFLLNRLEKKEFKKMYREYRKIYPQKSKQEIIDLVTHQRSDPYGPACH